MPYIPDYKPSTGKFSPAGVSIGAAMAPGKAVSGLGQEIVSAGLTATKTEQQIQDTAKRIQKTRGVDAMNQARESVRAALTEHEEFRAKNPDDPDKWESDLTTRISSHRETLFGRLKGISSEDRKKIDDQFSTWKTEYGTKTRVDAFNHGRAKARTRATGLSHQYRKAGDYTSARNVIEEGRGSIFNDDEVNIDLMDIDHEEATAKKREVVTKYEIGSLDDPIRALEALSAKNDKGVYLNDPDMDEGARVHLIKSAERTLDQKQREEMDVFQQGIDSGKISESEIGDLPVFLDGNQREALKAYYQRKQPPTDQEDAEAWRQIIAIRDQYEAAKAGSLDEIAYRKAHREARTAILQKIPPGYSGPLMESLQRYSPARLFDMKPNAPTDQDLKTDIRVEIRSTFDAAQDSFFFGRIDDETPPMEKEKVFRKRRDLERKVWNYVDRLKDPTPEAAREYADKLLGGERVKSTANDLRQFIPGSGQRFRPKAPMPALPPKQGSKDKASADLLPARQLETFLNSPKP